LKGTRNWLGAGVVIDSTIKLNTLLTELLFKLVYDCTGLTNIQPKRLSCILQTRQPSNREPFLGLALLATMSFS
jgi:hypothetical protein